MSTRQQGGEMQTRQRILFSGAVLLMFAAVAALYAQQKSAGPRKLSADDYIEIQQLYARYQHLVNESVSESDLDKIAGLWVEDGVFDNGSAARPPYRGRKEIASEYLPGLRNHSEGVASANRMFTDIGLLIDPTPEGAVGKSSLVRLKTSAERGQAPVIEFTGEYHDELVKTREGWRFKTRVFRMIAGGAPAFPELPSAGRTE
jgi:hypothetical protein